MAKRNATQGVPYGKGQLSVAASTPTTAQEPRLSDRLIRLMEQLPSVLDHHIKSHYHQAQSNKQILETL